MALTVSMVMVVVKAVDADVDKDNTGTDAHSKRSQDGKSASVGATSMSGE